MAPLFQQSTNEVVSFCLQTRQFIDYHSILIDKLLGEYGLSFQLPFVLVARLKYFRRRSSSLCLV